MSDAKVVMPDGIDYSSPRVLHLDDMKTNWLRLPRSEESGMRRGIMTPFWAQGAIAQMVVVPAGQSGPPHRSSAEHIHYHMSGEMDYRVGADDVHIVSGDLFFLPADVDYHYVNPGVDDASFLSIHTYVPGNEWPPRITYAVEGDDN